MLTSTTSAAVRRLAMSSRPVQMAGQRCRTATRLATTTATTTTTPSAARGLALAASVALAGYTLLPNQEQVSEKRLD